MLAILFLSGILQYWAIGLLLVYGFIGDGSHIALDFLSYYAHWSSVGGLVGFAVSRRGIRGSLIGAIIGLTLAEALRL